MHDSRREIAILGDGTMERWGESDAKGWGAVGSGGERWWRLTARTMGLDRPSRNEAGGKDPRKEPGPQFPDWSSVRCCRGRRRPAVVIPPCHSARTRKAQPHSRIIHAFTHSRMFRGFLSGRPCGGAVRRVLRLSFASARSREGTYLLRLAGQWARMRKGHPAYRHSRRRRPRACSYFTLTSAARVFAVLVVMCVPAVATPFAL
ncbi:hypothetical protein P280DRAFT_63012 [Massarina eburnea CBS 473.64]|uniref:Uncharacterized protein n=1 Tax=Massarina eburnea CBS 473.64 TaxID=1395130 RepID=A0A6A6RUK3_9PLEO|nr:hypothetical protein P280DRAFT_63012 [Massarina eburnea CBS 473.64]